MKEELRTYILKDDGVFPNSQLPVLHYVNAIKLPWFFKATKVKRLFRENGWQNNWRAGIYTYHHYHSNTHEALAVIRGSARLQLGGPNGLIVYISAGDVVVIPAGVAHKNLDNENDVICVGGYPTGVDYDMNYGMPEERPKADIAIAKLEIPDSDPVFGSYGPLVQTWNKVNHHRPNSH